MQEWGGEGCRRAVAVKSVLKNKRSRVGRHLSVAGCPEVGWCGSISPKGCRWMLENDARNQHFLTQGEQRLNALNPQADPSNLRIYSFTVIDRDNYTLALENPNGRSIGSNLSLFDVFSLTCLATAVCGSILSRCSTNTKDKSRPIRRACSPN
jgi:hypothetical protein